jgi:hypothetical protein
MSIKSTQRISRERALSIILSEVPLLPNDTLGDMMDFLADCGQSHHVSKFDNFIVSDFNNEDAPTE